MENHVLLSFLQKISLGGIIESVMIKTDNGTSISNFTSEEKTLVGEVSCKSDIPDSNMGVFNITQLIKLLNILNNEITPTIEFAGSIANKLTITDSNTILNYQLSDENIIPKPLVPIKEQFTPLLKVPLDMELMKHFVKTKNSLPDSNRVLFEPGLTEVKCILGENSSYANKISFDMPCEILDGNNDAYAFSSNMIKEIFNNNIAFEGDLTIYLGGLMEINLSGDDIFCKYYILANEE